MSLIHLKVDQLTDKKIIVVGLGKEGQSTISFLEKNLPSLKIDIADDKPLVQLPSSIGRFLEKNKNISFVPDWKTKLNNYDLIVKSAGISPFNTPFLDIDSKKIISSTHLFLANQPGKTVGITGTKGKSTTTAVIHHVLKQNNIDAKLGGNIGVPMLDLIEKSDSKTWFILELSSHQLWNLEARIDISVVQPIVPEHLDYYPQVEDYIHAKANLVRFQTEQDLCLLNQDNQYLDQFVQLSKAKQLLFGLAKNEKSSAYVEKCNIFSNKDLIISTDELPLKGAHNWQNVMPAILIAQELGLTTTMINQSLKTFTPLPHRLEPSGTVNQVEYINDSLATTQEASIQAILAFSPKKITLICGGQDRHQEHDQLAKTIIEENVSNLILFPETGSKIMEEIKKIDPDAEILKNTETVISMKDAVKRAHQVSNPDSVVLLSPAAPSFNMFKSYADRGQQFIEAVTDLSTTPPTEQ